MARPESPARITRRQFDILGTQIAGALVALALGIPIIGFLISPLFRRPQYVEREVGPIGQVSGAEPMQLEVRFPQSAWPVPDVKATIFVVRVGEGFKILSNVCTHMQCPVRWDPTINQFLCPCHGGLYDRTGQNVGGPPPKPLPEYVHRIHNGILYVQNRFTEQV